MTARRITFSLLLSSVPITSAWEETCSQFKDIYKDGTELCENMWADSFEVVDDNEPGYTMWFFDQENNPNDAVTRTLFGEDTVPDTCNLKYYHKEEPGPEGEDMTECHPWKKNACCDSTTVKDKDQLKESYGEGYEWDRCGPMSEACERFFVAEACLYECEPSAGLFRKYTDENETDYNEWQMHKMPIKKSWCDSWYTACKQDYFCGTGDYFECAAFYAKNQEAAAAAEVAATIAAASADDKALVIGLSVAGGVAVIVILFAGYLVAREKRGSPVFSADTAGVSS